jgi:hypothetical protein
MGYVRANEVVAVRHPESGALVTPNPSDPYRDDDPLVKEYPWLFASDADREQQDAPVEQATRAPGEKRTTARRVPKRS